MATYGLDFWVLLLNRLLNIGEVLLLLLNKLEEVELLVAVVAVAAGFLGKRLFTSKSFLAGDYSFFESDSPNFSIITGKAFLF